MQFHSEAGHAIIEDRVGSCRWKIRTVPGKCRRFQKLADARKWARANPKEDAEQGGPLMGLLCAMAGVPNPLTPQEPKP